MLTESTKKVRDPLAFALLGATLLYLVSSLALLFKDAGDFAIRAFVLQPTFTEPVWALVVVLAVLLAAAGTPSPQARVVAMVALGVIGLMVLLGLITWLAGYGADTFDGDLGPGKVTGTFAALARLAVAGVGGFVVFTVFRGLPAPVRQQQPQQQWGGPQGQQQWGQQSPQQQWGQQPGQWGAPAAGAAAGGAAGAGAWGQQNPPSEQSSSGYAAGGDPGYGAPQGYTDPYAPDPYSSGSYSSGSYSSDPYSSGQSSSGYAAGGDPGGSWGQPAQPEQPEQQQWGQPAQPEQPEQPAADPDATQFYGTVPESESEPESTDAAPAGSPEAAQPAEPAVDQRDGDQQEDDLLDPDQQEDDQRPGWWAPGS